MSLLRPLFFVVLAPLVGGCVDSDPDPLSHSPGFFTAFERSVNDAMAQKTSETQESTLTNEFTQYVNAEPSADELYAAGPTWDKIRSFLDIGLLSSEIMAGVNDSAEQRVDIYSDTADWVLRSDYVAITAYNQNVHAAYMIRPTAEIVWESLHLVLTASGHAERKVPVEKGELLDGYWTRTARQSRDLWVDGYFEAVWREGTCQDSYVNTSCTSFWIEPSCTDVWIDDGYWESTCSGYDEDGNCVEWTDEWISTGYYETQCVDGYYEEQCTDVYETICTAGSWEDVWIGAHDVVGATIPGELAWVEAHEAQEKGERIEVLPEQEAAILALGIEYVSSFGPDYVKGSCATALTGARSAFDTQPSEQSIKTSRAAILHCLSKH